MILYELCKKRARRALSVLVQKLHTEIKNNITCLTLSSSHLLISYTTHQSIDLPYIQISLSRLTARYFLHL